jgi:hypothetical protein
MAKFIEAAQDLETELAAFLRDAPDELFEQFEFAGLKHIGTRVSRIKNDIFLQRKRIQFHEADHAQA